MVMVALAATGAAAVVGLGGILVYRALAAKPVVVPVTTRRAYDLEARIRTVLTGPRQKYGEIFTDYSVWKSDSETRLELTAGTPWKALNEFTRCLIVRYLWRVLESLAGAAVVIVDEPQQVWNDEVDSSFRDQGFDWKTFGMGPQYVHER